MEPWEDEEKRAAWVRALVALGATRRQAEVAWLVDAGLDNKEIARRLGTSVSTTKSDIQVLFGILRVARRTRHGLAKEGSRVVEAMLRSGPSATAPSRPDAMSGLRRTHEAPAPRRGPSRAAPKASRASMDRVTGSPG